MLTAKKSTMQPMNRVLGSSNTIVQFYPVSTPQFSGTCQFDIKSKNYIYHEFFVGFQLPAITGVTGGSGAYYTPADFLWDRIEITWSGGNVVQNLYGDANFIQNQLFRTDESRLINNVTMGDYKTTANRITRSGATNYWWSNIKSIFNEVHFPQLTGGHEFTIKFFMNSAVDCINLNGGTGTPISVIQNAILYARVSTIDGNNVNVGIANLQKSIPMKYMYNDVKQARFNVASGVSTSSHTLSQITGNISTLFFVVRPDSTYNKDGNFAFKEILDFSLLDSSNTNISGGSVVPSDIAISQLGKWWSQSSYLAEALNGTSSSFVYMWSWSGDAVRSAIDGMPNGIRLFTGFEVLKLTYKTSLSETHTVDLWALQHNGLVVQLNKVEKITNFQ